MVFHTQCPPTPDPDIIDKIFTTLSKNYPQSAILSIQEKSYTSFIPKSSTLTLPNSIMEYRDSTTLQIPDETLLQHCTTFKLPDITQKQIDTVERETRKQSKSKIWYRQRAGRRTASKLTQIVRTNHENPSKSLIKSICYPEAYRFRLQQKGIPSCSTSHI